MLNQSAEGFSDRSRNFRRYPRYKASGVAWLGLIPEGWQVASVRRVGSIRYGLGEPPRERADGLPFVRATNVAKGVINDVDLKRVDPDDVPWDRDPLLRVDDIIVVRSGAYTGDSAIVPEAYGGAVAGYDMVLRVNKAMPKFVAWALLSPYVLEAQIALCRLRAAQPHLNAEELGCISLILPPLPEQQAVAAFLDRETSKIDALVAKKERLIELLQEKRATLITQAVTKGLDPAATMKDSGVEWLGEIPAHWSMKRLKYLVPDVTVGIVVTPAKYYVDEGIPCLRSLNISSGKIDMDDLVFIGQEANDYHRKSKIFEGDVVAVRTGQAGTAAVVPEELAGANCIDLLIVRRSDQIRPKMVYYYLNSRAAISQAEVRSVGAIQGHYNTSTLAELFVPVIPLEEQDRIVRYLDDQTASMDGLISTVRGGIDRMREFRTALISAAVTGKIDVRDESA